MKATRRNFLRGIAGSSLLGLSGCRMFGGQQKIKLAVVGVMGKGFSDWLPMLKSGLAEIVAFCDCDYNTRRKAQDQLIKVGYDYDMARVPFYTDYRRLLDDAPLLGVEAMTVSTTDHTHAPIAIRAMQMGIHVYVQKPLVRTLWELDYFRKTAQEYGVVTQMGNQGSSIDGFRRGVEVLQSGILGDVTEVHVWTNRPVWPQGLKAAECTKPRKDAEGKTIKEKVTPGLNWDCWLATAKKRPFCGAYPQGMKGYDPWKLCDNVYHPFSWRGFFDFGCGAFGDMACHTMNLPFRGLELGEVSDAECVFIEEKNDIAFPMKSTVVLTYKERVARFGAQAGKRLPAVKLTWYDGSQKPSADLFPDGNVPNTGCLVVGTKGVLVSTNDYGGQSLIALSGEKTMTDIEKHEACVGITPTIPRYVCAGEGMSADAGAKSVAGTGQYLEFLTAINGTGVIYEQTGSRCFSDIEYSIPQMEGILVGVTAQRVAGKLAWNSQNQSFDNSDANELMKPYIRKGFEF